MAESVLPPAGKRVRPATHRGGHALIVVTQVLRLLMMAVMMIWVCSLAPPPTTPRLHPRRVERDFQSWWYILKVGVKALCEFVKFFVKSAAQGPEKRQAVSFLGWC